MRTTLTIDDDLARELRQRMRQTHSGFKSLVNDVLRRGLSSGAAPAARRPRFVIQAKRRGFQPGVDPLRLNALADELDTDKTLTP